MTSMVLALIPQPRNTLEMHPKLGFIYILFHQSLWSEIDRDEGEGLCLWKKSSEVDVEGGGAADGNRRFSLKMSLLFRNGGRR